MLTISCFSSNFWASQFGRTRNIDENKKKFNNFLKFKIIFLNPRDQEESPKIERLPKKLGNPDHCHI